ncbi:MAG: serine/threonine protein kinase [Planctomycetes bacterium]|nr:serine/threonine protein kinase [Planctomycetota bacterium]MCB9869959.1 serine/threonine protein kinase [Planctomycetota bacterium]
MTDHDFGFRTDFYTFSPQTLAEELADFEIRREVGKGSMGIVYEAIRKRDGQRVALKVLPPSLTLTDRALARFAKEGELMSRIEHPSIVRVLEHGRRGRLHYFVMEFVDGTTLQERVQVGPLPVRHAAEIGATLGDALQFAHDHGVVHRDIKPGNVILAADGRVVITDFGLARETGTGSFTESGAIVGTPMYMAPEQILGHRTDVDTRADVYGLGATLFELLCGRPPFVAPTAQAVLRAVLDQEPPRPTRLRHDVPEALEAIVLRALEKRPTQRYGSALDMADDLRRFLAGERVLARKPTALGKALRAVRRHPMRAALLAVLGTVATAAVMLHYDRRVIRIERLLKQAELSYTKAISQPIHGFRRASAEERRNELVEAERLTSEVLAVDPNNRRARLTRARVRHSQRDWPGALADFDATLADLDAAAELLGTSREDLLIERIATLQQIPSPQGRRRLMGDLRALLELDRSTTTRCLVADSLLRMAAGITPGPARANVLDRARELLDGIEEPSGSAAIARAELLELGGQTAAARAAARTACIEFHYDAQVHAQAARIFRRVGDHDAARTEENMARLLRGDDAVAPPQQPPDTRPDAAGVDTQELRTMLEDLGRLFGSAGAGAKPAAKGAERKGEPAPRSSGRDPARR